MKTTIKLFTVAAFIISFSINVSAQKAKLAVLPLDAKGVVYDPQQLGNLLYIEVEKSNLFTTLDKYEVKNALEKSNIKPDECFSKSCIIEAGGKTNVDKILSGSVERYGEKLVVTLRMFDIKSGNIEKTQLNEFLNIQPEMQSMISITLNNMLGLANSAEQVNRLTKKSSYDNATNNPGLNKLSMAGPRMGLTYVFGRTGKRLTDATNKGGYDAYPAMTQFGYQYETQYLNSGNFQALVEVVPLVTGIDQGYFIPSITLMNGFRNTLYGFEFAFGPTIALATMAEGYYDETDNWHLSSEMKAADKDKYRITKAPDNRGDLKFVSGFVFAIGKTFKSGNLNIPVNAYIVPSKDGSRIGISFGFNTKK